MNKRMKDPKGDLRFVHKSTRVYDFWSLKLTAMACGRQAGRQETRLVVGRVSSDSQIPTSTFDTNLDSVLRISNFVFPPRTSYNTLKLHLQSHQEVRSGLRIEEVFGHQFTARSSGYKVTEGIAVGLVHLIEEIVDQ